MLILETDCANEIDICASDTCWFIFSRGCICVCTAPGVSKFKYCRVDEWVRYRLVLLCSYSSYGFFVVFMFLCVCTVEYSKDGCLCSFEYRCSSALSELYCIE